MTVDQANRPVPTNTPLALVNLLDYWKSNTLARPAIVGNQGTNYIQISFTRRPAESGITYHVQASTSLGSWTDIATYAGTNIVITPKAAEISRVGSSNELVTVRNLMPTPTFMPRFLRVTVTRP